MVATFTIEPGPRLTVRTADVDGAPGGRSNDVLGKLELKPGEPVDRQALQGRIEQYEETLRGEGFYEARVTVDLPPAGDTASVDVHVRVDVGPKVRVVFTGDPIPEDRRDTLVPIRRERSVDQEVLEDASRNIEVYLRGQGYRQAEAPSTRAERDGQLVVTFAVARGPLHRLAFVELRGQHELGTADLQDLLKLQPGEPFDDGRVATVSAAIAELYRVRGFASVTLTPRIEVLPEKADGGTPYRPVAVTLDIAEGPRTTVDAVRVVGASGIPEARIRQAIAVTEDKPFYRPQVQADRESVERLYRNEGYQRAVVEVQPILSEDSRRATLQFEIREGSQTRVDHVLVTGTDRTTPALVRREITLRPGEPLGYDAILASQQRLSALGLYRRVRITEVPHGSAGDDHDVLIEVQEAPSTTFSYGGGVEVGRRLRRIDGGTPTERIDVAPRGYVEVTRRNLWGKNRSISLLASASLRGSDPSADAPEGTQSTYGLNQYRVLGTFREPRLFDTAGDAQLTAFVERGLRSSFTFDRQGARVEYARRFSRGFTASVRYRFDNTELFNEQIAPEDQLLVDRLFPQVRLSTLFGALLRDSRDDVLDPLRGSVLGVDGELALQALGSEVGFGRSFLQGFVYRKLPGTRRAVVAAGARVGLARAFRTFVPVLDAAGHPVIGPDGQPVEVPILSLPASERFFAGGDTTVRGFALDRLGTEQTLDASGFPTGGNGLLVLNLELRSAPWKGLGAVTFIDAGNVYLRASDIDPGEIRTAAGVGLRYKSPIGPLRVDVGFKLDPRTLGDGTRERRAVLHISLGQAF